MTKIPVKIKIGISILFLIALFFIFLNAGVQCEWGYDPEVGQMICVDSDGRDAGEALDRENNVPVEHSNCEGRRKLTIDSTGNENYGCSH